jgi:tetratricopeptide (TPR) repeat protein
LASTNPVYPFPPDFDQAWQAVNESEAIFRELEDAWGLAEALLGKSKVAWFQESDPDSWLGYCQEAMKIFRKIGDRLKLAEVDVYMVWLLIHQGEYGDTRIILDEAIALGREFNSRDILKDCLWPSIPLFFIQSDYQQMEKNAFELYKVGQEYSDIVSMIWGLRCAGSAVIFQGQPQRARQLLLESLSISQEIEDEGGIIMFPILMAGVADVEGNPKHAARLIGAFEAQVERHWKSIEFTDQHLYQRILETVLSHLDEAIFEAEWTEGRKMTLEEAIEYAKDVVGKSV